MLGVSVCSLSCIALLIGMCTEAAMTRNLMHSQNSRVHLAQSVKAAPSESLLGLKNKAENVIIFTPYIRV